MSDFEEMKEQILNNPRTSSSTTEKDEMIRRALAWEYAHPYVNGVRQDVANPRKLIGENNFDDFLTYMSEASIPK